MDWIDLKHATVAIGLYVLFHQLNVLKLVGVCDILRVIILCDIGTDHTCAYISMFHASNARSPARFSLALLLPQT